MNLNLILNQIEFKSFVQAIPTHIFDLLEDFLFELKLTLIRKLPCDLSGTSWWTINWSNRKINDSKCVKKGVNYAFLFAIKKSKTGGKQEAEIVDSPIIRFETQTTDESVNQTFHGSIDELKTI